jgi:WD40 repeat protein/DNA-binding SARP family transcriptional activator
VRVAQGVRIAVLGPLRIDGIPPRITTKDRVVLEALSMRVGESVSVDWLIDALWGDAPPPSAGKNLQGCIVRLRKALGSQTIETTTSGYRLALSATDVDSYAFEQLVQRSRELLSLREPDRAAYVIDEALGLFTGEPFEDLGAWDIGAIEVERLREVRWGAEELQVDALLAAGQHQEALRRAHACVTEQPLRERRHVQLALAQYRSGEQVEALATLRELRDRLRDELGVDPGAEATSLEQAILQHDPSLVVADTTGQATNCPWPGLTSYDVEDRESFCGRDTETAACLRLLQDRGVLAVVGPSGSGKSSLLRAGIAASLQAAGRQVSILTPGRAGPTEADAVRRTPIRTVLLVDQLEEAFSPGVTPDHRAAYLDALARRGGGGELVVALRADRTPELSAEPELARLLERGWYLLSAMDAAGLRTAIERPARQAGLLVEPGLVDLLLREVQDEPGALPLLSHSLVETWNRREGRTLTVDGYLASGGVRGSIAQSAEAVYGDVPPEQRAQLKDLLMRLVAPGPEGEPTRIRIARDRVVTRPEQDGLVERLVGSRLLTSDDGNITLAHEALAREWPRLRGWLDDDVEGQRILHHLSAGADAWQAMGRPDSELYRGVRLARAVEWSTTSSTELAPVEQAFLDESMRLRSTEERTAEEQMRAQARTNRRLRVLLAAAVALLLVAAGLGALAQRSSDRAQRSTDLARQAALAREADAVGARALTTTDIPKSLLLAVAAARVSPTASTEADLAAALAQRSQLVTVAPSPGVGYAQLALSPDGTRLAATAVDGAVYLYDAATLDLLDTYQSGRKQHGGKDPNMPVAFSPDGATLAVAVSAPARPPVRLLSVAGDRLRPLARQPGNWPTSAVRTTSVSFSADGRRMAVVARSAQDPATVLVWDTRQLDRPIQSIALDVPDEEKVLLSADGSRLFITTPFTAYDVATGRRLYRRQLRSWIFGDVDGARLALLGFPNGANDVLLVSTKDGTVRRRLSGMPAGYTRTVAFSPDGSRVAAYGGTGTVYVWDRHFGELTHQLPTGDSTGLSLTFSPDGSTLYTAGGARQLLEWDLAGYQSYLQRQRVSFVIPKDFQVGLASSSPDGGRVAYLATDPLNGRLEAFFLDVATGGTSPVVHGRRPTYTAFGWQPDGKRVLVLTARLRVDAFDPTNGRSVANAHLGGTIYDFEYTPDGGRVVVAAGSTIEVLDADTLRRREPPIELGEQVMSIDPSPDGATAFVTLLPEAWNWHEAQPVTIGALVDLRERRVVHREELPMRNVSWAAFSPRGDQVAVVGDGGQVLLLDPNTWQPVTAPADPNGPRMGWVSYSHDGTRLLTSGGTEDQLWDAATGQQLGVVSMPQGAGPGGFQPDGTLILVSGDGIYRWDPSLRHAIEFACQAAGRDITADEWHGAFPDVPYRTVCPT